MDDDGARRAGHGDKPRSARRGHAVGHYQGTLGPGITIRISRRHEGEIELGAGSSRSYRQSHPKRRDIVHHAGEEPK